jgi:hypothetical protein
MKRTTSFGYGNKLDLSINFIICEAREILLHLHQIDTPLTLILNKKQKMELQLLLEEVKLKQMTCFIEV